MSRRLIATAAAVLACAIPAAAFAALTKVDSGTVEVEATVAKMFTFTGTSKKLSVSDDGKELKFSVPVTSITTENEDRDADMKERFSQGNVVLTVPRDKVKFPTDKETKGTVKGQLSLNGATTKDVSVTYKAAKTGGVIVVDADFVFDYTPHHSYKGEKGGKACKGGVVCVSPELKVFVKQAKFKE
jgi:polyisoprenoid-binding protein YceI